MPLKTIIFVGVFGACCAGAVFQPLWGIVAYAADYIIGPQRQWWERPIQHLGIRYSYVLAIVTAIGVALNYGKLRFGKKLLHRHEILLLLFLGLVWVLRSVNEPTELYTIVDHPTVKLAKVMIFGLMLTHVVTDMKKLRVFMWTLVVCTLILGLQAYTARRYVGRLETVGGADFAESNFLAVFVGAMVPLIGVLFLQSRWPGKLFCLGTGAFAVNAIILTRSRGALVGIALGLIPAVFLAPKKLRLKVAAGLLVGSLGAVYLMDTGFVDRMKTIDRSGEQRDASSQLRLDLWETSLAMVKDHPLGIGPGNFFQVVGRYRPELERRDAHSTYFRCLTELGIPGFLLFLTICFSAMRTAMRASRRAERIRSETGTALRLLGYGFTVALCTFLAASLTVTTIYTEALWWLLLVPVCLERAVANHAEETENSLAKDAEAKATVGDQAGGRKRRRSSKPVLGRAVPSR